MSLTSTGQPAARTELVRAAGAGPTDTIEEPELLRGTCPACDVAIGEEHADGCDVAECLATGRKRMWCRAQPDTAGHDCGRAYAPTVEHALATCEKCGTDVWIGPRQRQARVVLGDGAAVLCMVCAIQVQRQRGGGVIGHLGGGDGRPRLPG
ncbi:hypothetical protein [Micromonospora sp. CB01531]|uniref:hypothetical protein n=1 Tax=Micromonospora sp. CB01531 TaxID=1718947 RepID=UPI00093CA872|nr:hypothetical protein [Micromonospora sp. CB01531]OKI86611.1 hypothetical protein A6A27_39875 [Micromonospora sp. CB01531]